MSKRGEVTEEVQEIAREKIGREITKRELRLFPYINTVMLDCQRIDYRRINDEEDKILRKWDGEGYIEFSPNGISISKEFWDFICEVLYKAYVLRD